MERPRKGKWRGSANRGKIEGSLGNVQFLPSLKRLCGRRLEPIHSPQNRHLTSHLQSMGRNRVSWIVPVKQLSPWRQETFLSLSFMTLDEHKCSESHTVSYLHPVETPALQLGCTVFQPCILSEVISSVETSCCALPLKRMSI